jgi:hypothetical protein
MTKNQNQLQQGDVLLARVEALPPGAVQRAVDPRGIVLADGEATGHAHVIERERGVEAYECGGTLYVANQTGKPVALSHQEHHTITVDPGVWRVGIVREYDHLQDMERLVRD